MTHKTDNIANPGCIDTIYESDLDDENYSGTENPGVRERRRKLHTEAEQRRRNAIKKGFEGLLELVHPIKSDSSSTSVRMSKSTILHKANSMIEKLAKQKNQKQAELGTLENEAIALRTIKMNYEKVAQTTTDLSNKSVEPVLDEQKLQVFEMFANLLFSSFDNVIAFTSFKDLSGSVISWIEENFKSEQMSSLMKLVLSHVFGPNAEQVVDYNLSLPTVATANDARNYCDFNRMHEINSTSASFHLDPLNIHKSTNFIYSNKTNTNEHSSAKINQPIASNNLCSDNLNPNFPNNEFSISTNSTHIGLLHNVSNSSQTVHRINFPGNISTPNTDVNRFCGSFSFLPNPNKPSELIHSSLSTAHNSEASCCLTLNQTHDSSRAQYKQFIEDLL